MMMIMESFTPPDARTPIRLNPFIECVAFEIDNGPFLSP